MFKITRELPMIIRVLQLDLLFRSGDTPLHHAVLARAHDIIQLLLSLGASVDARNFKYCPFMCCDHHLMYM